MGNPDFIKLANQPECERFYSDMSNSSANIFPTGYVLSDKWVIIEFIDKGAYFGQNGELSCLSCHRMHRGGNKKALLIQENRQGSLCMECHKLQQSVLGSIHDMGMSAPDALNVDSLSADESGVCGGCHKSHGWARERTLGEPTNSAFCVECHEDGGLAWEERPYVEVHPVNVSLPDDWQIDLPLRGGERRLTCGTCHDPHSGGETHALLRMPDNDLCVHCHEGKQEVFSGKHDPVNGSWAEEMGLEAQGLCIDCHQVHRIEEKTGVWTLLKDEREGPLACEGCHRTEGPGTLAGTRHLMRSVDSDPIFPLEKSDTSDLGSIMCITCHEIHQGAEGNKLLRASREDSEICLQCHPNSKLVFDTPHDFRNSAPDVANVIGEKVGTSGPCETCHLIHDAEHGKGPWAFEPVGAQEYVENLCIGCHQEGKAGERFIPQFTEHPDVPLFNRITSENAGFFPTYDGQGERLSTGLISCLSCHDPHITNTNTGSDTPAPGSSMGKFLRPYAQQNLCVDCHGKEGIWRYLYFHKRRVLPNSQYRDKQ